jgi:hypothetical protein
MLWLPASKLMTPSPMLVLLSLIDVPLDVQLLESATRATGFATGLNPGKLPGRLPKLSANVTLPVGAPWPEFPATSARTKTKLPNGSELPFGNEPIRLLFTVSWQSVTLLPSGKTVTGVPGESLGAKNVGVETPA